MQIATNVVNKNNPINKTRLPDFGNIVIDPQTGEFKRITAFEVIELMKIPTDNCLPTELVTNGIKLEKEEYEEALKALLNIYKDEEDGIDKAVNQLLQISNLLAKSYPTRSSTIRYYPFCRVVPLKPAFLNIINKLYGYDIEHKAYIETLKAILQPKFLEKVFRMKGVTFVPEFHIDETPNTTISTNNNKDLPATLREMAEQLKQNKQ